MQPKVKRFLLALTTILALACFALPAIAKEETKDKAAVVNGSVITRGDLENEVSRVKRRVSRRGGPPSNAQLSQIQQEALESLISRELLYQESQKEKIKVDDAAVNERLMKLKKRYRSEAEFKTMLQRSNLSEDAIKSQFRREMVIQQFIDQKFVRKATVSDKETKSYYDSNRNFFKQPEQVRASHILIKVDPKADKSQKEKTRKKIEPIRQRLQKGEDFAALAKESSECPSSNDGGDLGYFKRGQMVKPFQEAAFALDKGKVSNIVETRFGYHLIKVTDKKSESTKAYKEVKDQINQYLKQSKVNKQVGLYVNKLKEQAKVERFVKATKEMDS